MKSVDVTNARQSMSSRDLPLDLPLQQPGDLTFAGNDYQVMEGRMLTQ